MHPPISLTNTLNLPLTQIYGLCNKLSCVVLDKVNNSQQERLNSEQQLWNEIKKIRSLNDENLFEYLIGFYHTLLYQLGPPKRQDDLFYYHILIRLGDLSRYMDRPEPAKFYYCNARNLFPLYGHAYNQLALLTSPNDEFKCCYYYARAAKSVHKPLNRISDNNLRIAVAQYGNELLSHIINEETSELKDSQLCLLPKTPYDWFYLMVLTTYVDNLLPIGRPFLNYLNINLITPSIDTNIAQNGHAQKDSNFIEQQEIPQSNHYPILLGALDIMVDWIRLGSQKKLICNLIGEELRRIKSALQIISKQTSSQANTSGTSNTSISTTASTVIDLNQSRYSSPTSMMSISSHSSDLSLSSIKQKIQPAMFHDYILRGYTPLEPMHKNLTFTSSPNNKLHEDANFVTFLAGEATGMGTLLKLIDRIRGKLDDLTPLLRKKTRNIALESILSRS